MEVYDSRIGNISYPSDFEEINRGFVTFGGNPKGGKITGKDTECIVLSSDFKFLDDNDVLLRVPRENNMYNVDLKNIVPSKDLTCLFTKATLDESNLWHRRLGHINFKPMNKLVKELHEFVSLPDVLTILMVTFVIDLLLRRRGRPKLRWEDRVKHDMKELLLSEDMTSDRMSGELELGWVSFPLFPTVLLAMRMAISFVPSVLCIVVFVSLGLICAFNRFLYLAPVPKALNEFTQKLNQASTDLNKAEAEIGVDVHSALNSALTSYSVYFVDADDTVPQKVVVHKDGPRGIYFQRAGPRQRTVGSHVLTSLILLNSNPRIPATTLVSLDCKRFHSLEEFVDGKRSCIKRLH
uniref:Ribonuclease H-like domain-containing protein n=1 Tax=Tanacetum cinerariifolium TaxID=118510 RepID=A0A6L2LDE9_TANCI|nr:ribonuclease H-like domain-containing protein [Tanacetum cinerariifolium]